MRREIKYIEVLNPEASIAVDCPECDRKGYGGSRVNVIWIAFEDDELVETRGLKCYTCNNTWTGAPAFQSFEPPHRVDEAINKTKQLYERLLRGTSETDAGGQPSTPREEA